MSRPPEGARARRSAWLGNELRELGLPRILIAAFVAVLRTEDEDDE